MMIQCATSVSGRDDHDGIQAGAATGFMRREEKT
jgi:hypothetical protein